MFENYDSHGFPMRSCDKMREPHREHDWKHPKMGIVHCWGRNPLPVNAEQQYCTPGCTCLHCVDIRAGLHPGMIMCMQRWDQLSWEDRVVISESIAD